MPSFPDQVIFLQQLKEKLPPTLSMAEELADLLQLSTDSVYRRIRGDSALSFDETLKICKHFSIPLEALSPAPSESFITFEFRALQVQSPLDVQTYFQGLLADLKYLVQIPDANVIYAAGDLPLFLHLQYPEHAAFKIFFWLKSVLNVPFLQQQKFSRYAIPQEILDLSKQILLLYNRLQIKEIWNAGVCENNLKQIRYYWESNYFESKEDALTICNQLLGIIQTAQDQAIHESKNGDFKNYQLYLSEIEVGNNCILVEAAGTQRAYLRHQTFQYLSTGNTRFCKQTHDWMQSLLHKSILISGASEKERNRFFDKRKSELEALVKLIQ